MFSSAVLFEEFKELNGVVLSTSSIGCCNFPFYANKSRFLRRSSVLVARCRFNLCFAFYTIKEERVINSALIALNSCNT